MSCTSYANGLRQIMTVTGQPAVSYRYDAANGLTGIGRQGPFHLPRVKAAATRVLLYHDSSRQIRVPVMTTAVREKFSSQAAPDVLAEMRKIAAAQGRQFQSVLDEALREYIDRQRQGRPRRHVLASFAASIEEFDRLYRELAK